MHAHFLNIAKPGSYNNEMNKILKLSNLPEIKIPEDPPSLQILTNIQEAEEDKTKDIHKETEKGQTTHE